MYRHLLVPIDASDLSVEVVGSAVAVARSLGARISFFHAVPNHSASLQGDAEILRVTQPTQHAYLVGGRARELLAKAEAAARAFGVTCTSHHGVHDEPAAAIVAAARQHGCDLIVMASHGRRSRLGMAWGSDTLSVLMSAGLPVLVTHTGELGAPSHAIGILRDEHRAMAAVLHAWTDLLEAPPRQDAEADMASMESMESMLRYLREFPQAVHHPKEERELFSRLRQRDPALSFELDELERQHERDRELLNGLSERLAALRVARDGEARAQARDQLVRALQAYAAFVWNHLGREESVILPAARRCLTAEDWRDIDAAFASDRDPGFPADVERSCRSVFSCIVDAGRSGT